MLRRGPKSWKSIGVIRKKCFFRRKSAISLVRWNFHLIEKSFWRYSCRIWRYLVCRHLLWATFNPKQLIRGLSCMHKLEKYIEILWDHQKKLPSVKHYKEFAICAILRENTPLCLAATEAKTCCTILRTGHKIMQIPLRLSEKICIP